jgi:Ca2+/Na+ antiporter
MSRTTHDRTTRPDRAERRAAVLDDPRFERFRDRTSRRRLVLALVGLLVVEAVVLMGFAAAGSPGVAAALGVVVLVLLVGFVVLLGALKASTRGVEELPREVLDEREVQVRGEVYARAYRLGFALLSVLLLGVAVSAVAGWSVPDELVLAGAVVTFHVAIVLPTLVAAWLAD